MICLSKRKHWLERTRFINLAASEDESLRAYPAIMPMERREEEGADGKLILCASGSSCRSFCYFILLPFLRMIATLLLFSN